MSENKLFKKLRDLTERIRRTRYNCFGDHSCGAAIILGAIAVVAVVAMAVSPSGCVDPPPPPSPPPPPPVVLPEKELVEDIRFLWSYMRNFAHIHKRLPSSIEEMGAGYAIGTDGSVLRQSIWDARWDSESDGVPATYRIQLPGSTEKVKVGAYRFRIVPVVDEDGNDSPFTRVLSVFPQSPSGADVCFVALCGPVDLRNDFSFSKAWQVYELRAERDVVELLRTISSTTTDAFSTKLSAGDDFFDRFVKMTFWGLEWPESANNEQGP